MCFMKLIGANPKVMNLKVVDLISRRHDFIEKAPDSIIAEVLDIIKDLI